MADESWLEERQEFLRILEKEATVLRQRAQDAEHALNESGEGLQGDILDSPSQAENEEDRAGCAGSPNPAAARPRARTTSRSSCAR